MIETRNKDWRNNQSGFGYRLLTKMGWSEGNGLGKNKQGSTDIITVKKRTTGLGLGTSEDQLGHHAWSETSSTYENLLTHLRGKYSKVNINKTPDAPKNETDESETEGKGQNNKTEHEDDNKEETNSKSKQVVEKKMTTKFLSYHKVLKSKNVSLYSQEDLAAILGSSIHKNPQPTQVESIQTTESSVTISGTVESINESNNNQKEKEKEKRKREVESDETNIRHEPNQEQETKKRKKKEKKSKK